ncbi:MAG: B3/4 domain-containing protein [Muribaculaceae bacterium]
MEIVISDKLRAAAPEYFMVLIEADVVNCATSEALWQEIEEYSAYLRENVEVSQVNKRPGIAATRQAYKSCGKDPNRYRPASEALCRRVVKGMELYRIDALVDLINLLSMRSGYSIGGFDGDKIVGETLTLGIGEEGEPFEGIGRGVLNIAGLPVYRDEVGGIGTPTSDNERTKIDLNTRHAVICINIYGQDMAVDDTISLAERLLRQYVSAENVVTRIVK